MSVINVIAEHKDSIELEVYFVSREDVGPCDPCGGSGQRPAVEVTAYILDGMYPCPACGGTGRNWKRGPDRRVRCFAPKNHL